MMSKKKQNIKIKRHGDDDIVEYMAYNSKECGWGGKIEKFYLSISDS